MRGACWFFKSAQAGAPLLPRHPHLHLCGSLGLPCFLRFLWETSGSKSFGRVLEVNKMEALEKLRCVSLAARNPGVILGP